MNLRFGEERLEKKWLFVVFVEERLEEKWLFVVFVDGAMVVDEMVMQEVDGVLHTARLVSIMVVILDRFWW